MYAKEPGLATSIFGDRELPRRHKPRARIPATNRSSATIIESHIGWGATIVTATPELIAAYKKALYVVFGRPELVLRIGERNPDLDELLEAEGAATAAYITAANPRGEARTAWQNEIANAALVELQTKAGHACYEGEGRDPEERWTPERSVLVIGISRLDAEAVGRAFEQNAIVFVEKGRAPELVVLKE